MRPDDERYFERIESRLDEAFDRAEAAKAQGRDPEPEIEIPVARDMADRVENILGIDGVAERVRELEGEMSREEAALELVTDFVEGSVGEFDSRAGKVEGAVRTAVALLTEGVVAAPIEGIDRVELLQNDDGTEFINVYYAGPIRSAGGTAQALSVLVADYARSLLDIEEYRARSDEIERYAEEVSLYDKETGLQYTPKDKETKFIAEHLPIMLDGEATGDEEVSGFRDLDRVDTNAARGGMCLVLAEGIALKAPKIQRYTRELEEVDWPWLQELIDGTIGEEDAAGDGSGEDNGSGEADGEGGESNDEGLDETGDDADGSAAGADGTPGPPRPEPSEKFLRDLIAGRPVFSHPSEPGGFRLRYGRARNHGFATGGIHPATMHIVDDFLAAGTQIKTERPGKAHGIVPVDSIEGPTVRLANGDVRRIDDPEEALAVRNGVEEIIDAGEYLVNYGEFVENNHSLSPASYTVEWWVQEFEAAGADVQALRDDPHVDLAEPTVEEALSWAREYDCPLHPKYTYLWHDIDVETFEALAEAVADGETVDRTAGSTADSTDDPTDGGGVADGGAIDRTSAEDAPTVGEGPLVIERTETTRRALEYLLVEHTQRAETLEIPTWRPLARSLGIDDGLERTWESAALSSAREYAGGDNAVAAVNAVAPFEIRERAPTRIGNRMGRPEKSESRELSPAVHTLFPITEAGGSQRDIAKAAKGMDERGRRGMLEVDINDRVCPDCGDHSYHNRCPDCEVHTELYYECGECGTQCEPDESGRVVCPRCEWDVTAATRREIDLNERFHAAMESVAEREAAFDVLKGVKGLSSEHKVPEPIEKGILRAKHGVSSFKDGTVRYDMTDLPVTAVRPAELDVTADQFRELGYVTDIDGEPLRHDDQLVELKVQDVVLSDGAAEHMMKTAEFVDELLEDFYGLPPFYELDDREDLVGELVFGMAPHTSAATVGRVVGFTSAAVGYAHPYFHAAKRRNCFHPETKLWYEDEAGELRYERISAFVEEYLGQSDVEYDDFGTAVGTLEDTDSAIRVPSLTPEGELVYRPVEAVSRHPAPDHTIRIRTQSGRSITVTPDHEVHVYDVESDQLVGKEARELNTDDRLVTPRSVDRDNPGFDEDADPKRFDLLEEFIESEAVPNDRLMIKGLDKDRLYDRFEETFADDWDGQFYPLQGMTEVFGTNKKTLSNYLYRESFPASSLQQCFSSLEELLEFVPEDVTLGMKRDRTVIDRFVELDERVATLLGYYAAEGFAREQETPNGTIHQTTICGTEAEAREFFIKTFRDEFGVEPYEENHAKITVSGRLLRVFFDTILDVGIYAHTKRVPDPIFDASEDVIAAYLGGYFSGDGSIHSRSTTISACTVSRELKEDIIALLTRLGIDSRVTEAEPAPLHECFPEFYDQGSGTSRPSYEIRVTGDGTAQFADLVGFHLTRKNETRLENVASRVTSERHPRCFDGGNDRYLLDPIDSIETTKSDVDEVYSLTVEDTHTVVVNDLSSRQCDGDEDCVMLLMDGLLNFSRQYLPDKRGGSVAEESRLVAVDPEDRVRYLTFDELWNALEAPIEVDGKFRKRTCVREGWQTYAFDANHESSLEPIEKAIRYCADEDDELLRIQTQFGRSLKITPNHSLFRYDDGIEEVAGEALDEGDLIVAPQSLDIEPTGSVIDVAECVPNPYVFIDDRVEKYLRRVWEGADHGSETRAAFDGGLSYRLSKKKTAFETLEEIEMKSGEWRGDWNPKIGLKGSSEGIPRFITLDEEFAWLLGIFSAEGSLSSSRPTIHNSDEELVRHVERITEDKFDTSPSVRWSNKAYEVAFPAVFREVLFDLGFADKDSYNSSEKIVPDPILRGERSVVTAFLRGFIAGDGSETTNDNHTTIGFHTTSEDLKDGIVFLLHRLGLVANISRMERDDSRQPIYTVNVSGGSSDNPLRRILQDEETYQPKSLVVTVPDALMEIREMEISGVKQLIPKYLKRRENISVAKLEEIVTALDDRDLPSHAAQKLGEIRPLVDGDLSYLRITDIDRVDYDGYLYDLQVGGEPIFTANWLYAHNSMDAPLVMSSRIDPSEIDDEAHNMDIVRQYPLEFYEATRRMADPGEVEELIQLGEDTLGTDDEYRGFDHTHDTTDIAMGPDLSAYKTLGSMMDKMDAQLELARKLRAVDETDVAERVIEYHFLPDLIGNLRAFSRQETRCLDCETKFRRMPLSGECRNCGGTVNLTVHEGSVNKYMDTAIEVADRFDCREYTKQRLEILDRALESTFEDDTNKQSGIADFM
ncbi:DNA polymerase II large subunit [Halalkaliarchaeum desulfuricum]|uniref:DNA polymerase II large subunit n=1 Tax=Halalkaliarchaeum desulfuricum TaxID=2055893 RepID=A0A343TJX4_9EURY|nr:LAGLIDADG family homing endonuclease [Halalkaliarchaeum desulfuricum]AUX09396.1 DNA polymerase II large subunit [Halalkaliarchaeum desulfuricum]